MDWWATQERSVEKGPSQQVIVAAAADYDGALLRTVKMTNAQSNASSTDIVSKANDSSKFAEPIMPDHEVVSIHPARALLKSTVHMAD